MNEEILSASQGSMFQYQFKRDTKGQERWSIKAAFVVATPAKKPTLNHSWEFFQFISQKATQTISVPNKVPLEN